MQHLRKLISSFHREHPNKPTTTSKAINLALPMVKATICLNIKPIKRKQGCSTKNASKHTKKN